MKRRPFSSVALAAVMAVGAVLVATSPARAERQTVVPVRTTDLGPSVTSGTTFSDGQFLSSPDGTYRLVMQHDGNLVLYDGATALWATGTSGPGGRVVVQRSGDLTLFVGNDVAWSTGTGGFGDSKLTVQDDANVVLYRNGLPTWSRFSGYAGHQLPSHGALRPGEVRTSPNQRFVLKMRRDGNLVTYDRRRKTTTWSTSTAGPDRQAVLQGDGDLTVYHGFTTVWSTKTAGKDGSTLQVQDDGNLVLYDGGTAAWSSKGRTGALRGNDYPAALRAADRDALVDPWLFYNRECTSFVAWRLNSTNGAGFTNTMTGPNGVTGRFGHADNWGPNAQRLGYRVDATPAVGAVAWWDTRHVAWVARVNADGTIVVEEYNRGGTGQYATRTIDPRTVTGFIHLKDL